MDQQPINPDMRIKHLEEYKSENNTLRSRTTVVRNATMPQSLDVFDVNGKRLFKLNIFAGNDNASVDVIIDDETTEHIKILAWHNGKPIANKDLPSRAVTVCITPHNAQ